VSAGTAALMCAGVLCVLPIAACHGIQRSTSPEPVAAAPASVSAVTLSPDHWELPPGGGSLDLVITTTGNTAGNVAAPHVVVLLRTSGGTLSASSVETDFTGHARVTWSGAASATITAEAADILATSRITVRDGSGPFPPPVPPPPPGDPTPGDPAALIVSLYPVYGPVVATVPVTFAGAARDYTGALVPDATYDWDFNGDGVVDRSGSDRAPVVTFPSAGRFVILLVAHAPDGRAGRGQYAIDILPAGGPIAATLTASSVDVRGGEPVTLRVTITPPVPMPGTIRCDWNLGTTGATTTTIADGVSELTTTFPSLVSVQTVTATVTTPDGRTASAIVKITVRP